MDDWQDDVTISDQEGLLRRVPNWPNMVKYDANQRKYRPTSACFNDPDGGVELSITLETPLLEQGGTYETAAKNEGFGVAKVSAGFARNISNPKQCIMKVPTADDPHHGLIAGEKSKSEKRRLAKEADMVVNPTMTA